MWGRLGLLGLLILSGCLARQSFQDAGEVTVLVALPPQQDCQDLGEIIGIDGDGQNCAGFAGRPGLYDNALEHLKRKAARQGANALILQESIPPFRMEGNGCQRNQWQLRAKVYRCKIIR